MSVYLFSLAVLSIAVSIAGILSSTGRGDGLSRHVRFLASLILLCLLVSPLGGLLERIRDWKENDFWIPDTEVTEEDYTDRVQSALDEQSHTYFVQMLTLTLEEKFQIPSGHVRCVVVWNDAGTAPTHVTVLLSGKGVWSDPAPIKQTVEELLNCSCDIVIE